MANDGATPNAARFSFWLSVANLEGGTPAQRVELATGLLKLRRLHELFDRRRKVVEAESRDAASVHFTLTDGGRASLLERPELYRSAKVPWIPRAARWPVIRGYVGHPNVGQLIDAGIAALEVENPALAGTFPRNYGAPRVPPKLVDELIRLVDVLARQAVQVLGAIEATLLSSPSASTSVALGESPEARRSVLRSLSSNAPFGKLLDRLDDQLRELDRLIEANKTRSGR